MDLIFVQIASYRDADLPITINSALENAEHPDRLRFGICWQYDERTYTDLDPYVRDPRFRVEQHYYEDSLGCCWARNRTNLLYDGEDYTLQIDAHTRFAPRWDTRYVSMIKAIDSDKPLLTTYPAPFTTEHGVDQLSDDRGIQRLTLNRIRKDLTTVYKSEVVETTSYCMPSRFIAAGQIFTLGRLCNEVEYDPNLYYAGEEINLAARAYTHGYDFFCPNDDLIWHRYQHHSPTHWADHGSTQHDEAVRRLQILLTEDHTQLGRYGLGAQRGLSDFEEYVGIYFKERLERKPKPTRFRRTIEFDLSKIENRDDYRFWIFTLRNVDDEELYRRDIYDKRILKQYVERIEVDELLEDEPVSYMIWPNVKGEGFLRQHFYDLQR